VLRPTPPSRLLAVAKATGAVRVVSESFRDTGGWRATMLTHEGSIIADRINHDGLQRTELSTGERSVIADVTSWLFLGSVDNGYVYYAQQDERPPATGALQPDSVMRVRLEGGEPEPLHHSLQVMVLVPVIAKAGYVYWVDDRHLVRKRSN
jgi:hypothetical protein